MYYKIFISGTVQESGRSRMEKDGVESLALVELALATSVLLGACPGFVYLFYSEDSVLVNVIVSILQALSPVQISAGLGLLLCLGVIQVTLCVAFSFMTPQSIIILTYVNSISSWIYGFTKQW